MSLRGYSLIGKTAILHIAILGSSPNISINIIYIYASKKKLKKFCINTSNFLIIQQQVYLKLVVYLKLLSITFVY